MAADDDPVVNPADNAGGFFAALRHANVPAELHVIFRSVWLRYLEDRQNVGSLARSLGGLVKEAELD